MKYLLLVLTLLTISSPAFAAIELKDVHAFETSAGAKNGVALMQIFNNADKADKLVSASSPVATEIQIHQMSEENGVMKMREVGGIPLKSGESVILNANGYHLMLMGLKKPLAAGKFFPLNLKFQNGGEILTTVRVETRGAKIIPSSKDGKDMDHSGHMDMK